MSGGVIQDSRGNNSSKRVAGFAAMGSGIALLVSLGVMSLFKNVADPATVLSAGTTLAGIGGGLLTAGVLENIRRPSTVIREKPKEEAAK